MEERHINPQAWGWSLMRSKGPVMHRMPRGISEVAHIWEWCWQEQKLGSCHSRKQLWYTITISVKSKFDHYIWGLLSSVRTLVGISTRPCLILSSKPRSRDLHPCSKHIKLECRSQHEGGKAKKWGPFTPRPVHFPYLLGNSVCKLRMTFCDCCFFLQKDLFGGSFQAISFLVPRYLGLRVSQLRAQSWLFYVHDLIWASHLKVVNVK